MAQPAAAKTIERYRNASDWLSELPDAPLAAARAPSLPGAARPTTSPCVTRIS